MSRYSVPCLLTVVLVGALRASTTVPFAAVPQSTSTAASNGQLPPAASYRAGQAGLTLPRVLREVKPDYTPEALRAGIEGKVTVECVVLPDGTVGDVTVVKHLDVTFGLDQQAVKAAKQWRFTPAMKDNVAVPVVVTIELTFIRRGGRTVAPLAWPGLLTSAGATTTPVQDWTTETVESPGIAVRFSYPKGWRLRKDVSEMQWFGVQNADGTLLLVVTRPHPQAAFSHPLTFSGLDQIATALKQRFSTMANHPRFNDIGQVEAAGRLWLWYDSWVPMGDVRLTTEAGTVVEAGRQWTFTTSVGTNAIEVMCSVMHSHDVPEGYVQEEQRAGPVFREMVSRLSISVQ